MYYFRNLPVINYDIKGTKPYYFTSARNIMIRQKIRDAIKNSVVTLYPYRIVDGDRPDILAELYYDNPSLYWLIFLINDVKDPYYDWPLSTVEFDTYIKDKYGSSDAAQAAVHEYYQIIRAARTNSKMVDDDEAISKQVRYIIDSTTYDSLASGSKGILYKYDWEFEMNENKRNIKLIDKTFASQIVKEAARIFV